MSPGPWGAAPGTVHRRNIYRKLKIKSRAGLFARFVEVIDARIR
ncbi:hypothetical protein [Mesorhizobium erdmanii]|nr:MULTISPECIES: hypothetical protein [Mesorhizobium]